MYATTDETDPTEYFVEYKDRAVIDKWILSKFCLLYTSDAADDLLTV